jgi:hypothetical protein
MASMRRPWPRVPGADVQPTFWTCVLTSKSLEEFVEYACAGVAMAPTLRAINPAAAIAAARVRQFAPFKNFVLWFTGLLFCLSSLPEMKRDRVSSDGQNRLEECIQRISTVLTYKHEKSRTYGSANTRSTSCILYHIIYVYTIYKGCIRIYNSNLLLRSALIAMTSLTPLCLCFILLFSNAT